MRGIVVAALILAAAGCSDNRVDETAGEDLSPASTPGVAWSFHYDFLVDDRRIESVQERHAGRCEQLGPARCRITGLRYSLGENEDISAMLQVRLAPSIARQFGRLALADVRGADGKLVRTEFNGEDVGSAMTQARNDGADTARQIADIQRRIADLRPGSPERAELQRQLEALQGRATEQRNAVQSGEQRLAFTPMTFNYYSEGGIPGFRENPLKASFALMVSSFVTMISFVLKAIGLLLPWVLLLGLLVLLWRSAPLRVLRRWWSNHAAPEGYRGDEAEG